MKRYALITGAAGGIGRATTELFAAEGWDTIAVDRREAEPFPPGVLSRRADVAVPADVEALFAWLEERTDRLDALVNNAAVQICKPMVDLSVEEWDSVMASNLRSAFLTARMGHRLLRAAGGAIVNIQFSAPLARRACHPPTPPARRSGGADPRPASSWRRSIGNRRPARRSRHSDATPGSPRPRGRRFGRRRWRIWEPHGDGTRRQAGRDRAGDPLSGRWKPLFLRDRADAGGRRRGDGQVEREMHCS
jgi:hypothetical protein